MLETISEVTLGELIGWTSGGLVLLGGLIEISPIKWSPLTWLARKIGRTINGEILEKVEKLEVDIRTMQAKEDERDIKHSRTRVLRFGDELIHDVHHSKEHFEDILQDISDYEKYCDEHKDFKNDRLHITAQLIKDTYRRCMEEHSFL